MSPGFADFGCSEAREEIEKLIGILLSIAGLFMVIFALLGVRGQYWVMFSPGLFLLVLAAILIWHSAHARGGNQTP